MTGEKLPRLSDEELDRLARELPAAAPSPERVERSRDALLALAMAEEAPARRRRGMLPGLIALAALVLLTFGLSWQLAHRGTTSSGVAAGWTQLHHARIHADEGTHLAVHEAGGDELVRLNTGSLSVRVQKLKHGERFRIATADAEVEVHGTVFDVVAHGDRLVAVRVLEGLVEVRPSGRPTVMLPPGHHWEAGTAGGADATHAPGDGQPAGPDHAAADVHPLEPGQEPSETSLPAPRASSAARPVNAASDRDTARAKVASVPQIAVSRSVPPVGGSRSSAHDVIQPYVHPPSPAATGSAALPTESGRKSHGIDRPDPASKRLASAGHSSPAELAFQRGWEALEQAPARAAYAFADAAGQAGGGALAEDARFWEAVALVRSRNARARSALVRFIDLYPGSSRTGEVAAMLGWVLLENGEREAAKTQFERALRDPAPAVRENGRQGIEAISRSTHEPSREPAR